MPFRRRSVKKLSRKSLRTVHTACEALESRRLLTALVNGTFQGTNSPYEGSTIFEYRQGSQAVRISVTGNITAEFIGGTYDPSITNSSHVAISDLVPATAASSDTYLFSIYIVHADLNSAISIAAVANPNTTGTPRPMIPFTGSVQLFNGSLTLGDGAVYIGCLTPQSLNPNDGIPLLYAERRAFGMRPSSGGELWAGVETAPGVSIGKIFIGGTITGVVDVAGDMNTFYAGHILTGNAQGIGATDAPGNVSTFGLNVLTPTPRNNFHIGGDIRNIIAGTAIGTDTLAGDLAPGYKTGFQLQVGGRVGRMYIAGTNGTNGSFLGSATINDGKNARGSGAAQDEIEVRGPTLTGDASYFDPFYFGIDITPAAQAIAATDRFNSNDTFGTAEFLGSTKSSTLKQDSAIQLRGVLDEANADLLDFYAIPLLAGQTVDFQLLDDYVGKEVTTHPRLGIFDPEGRLIASDYLRVDPFGHLNKSIRITASHPGAYRVAIGAWGDTNFSGAAEDGEGLSTGTSLRYELRVTNIGDIAFGGLISTGEIATLDVGSTGLYLLRGDMGEIRAGVPVTPVLATPLTATNLTGATGVIVSASVPWRLATGNLRAIEAVSVGIATEGSAPDFIVAKGSVGYLRATGTVAAGQFLCVNDDPQFPNYFGDLTQTRKSIAVGKDIQLVESSGSIEGNLLANGRIGVIRGQQVGGLRTNPPIWQANVDGVGNDGTIDLIDTVGDLNSPAITTGPGGNVRYMHVGGFAFRDSFFGGGTPEDVQYDRGQKVTLTDDSGTQVVLTPLPLDPNTTFPIPQNALSDFLDPPVLTVETYPIRDKAGEVIVRVIVTPQDDTSDGTVRQGGGGLLVESGARGPNGSVEIGEVARGNPSTLNAALPVLTLPAGTSANPITFNPYFRIYTQTALTGAATDPRDVNFVFKGKSTIDVWNINDLITGDTITSISNQTNGEIVNINSTTAAGAIGNVLPDVQTIEAETLGLARTNTGTALGQFTPISNVFPFVNQRTAVRVADVETIRTRRGMGNILAQNIGTVVANSDHKNVSSAFEGINGPIVSTGTTTLTGNIVSVDVGEGILPSGTGMVAFSGLYADEVIDSVTGKNADIRGNIVAAHTATSTSQVGVDPVTGVTLTNPDGTPLIMFTPRFAIGSISLKGGSIVGATIMGAQIVTPAAVGAPAPSNEGFLGGSYLDQADNYNNPIYDIGPVTVSGSGGVLGASFFAPDVGLVSVKGGFGVISSAFGSFADGVMAGIVADGYGIRDVVNNPGVAGGIQFAGAYGGAGLRELSARGNGKQASATSFASSVRFSEKYKFDPYSGQTLDEFNDLHKYLGTSRSKPKNSGMTQTGVIMDSRFVGSRDLGEVNAYKIVARDVFEDIVDAPTKTRIPFGDARYPMVLSFGNQIESITIRSQINGLFCHSGSIDKIDVNRDVVASSFRVAGRIKSIQADMLRSSSAFNVTGPDGQIDSITVKHGLASNITVQQGVGSIDAGTNVSSKKINIGGNVKSFSVKGSILTGSHTVIGGTLSKLFIAHDIKAGASLEANAIDSQTINGQVIGDIIIS